MSDPAIFVLVRDGQRRFYANRWASIFLHRELLFGPDDFEQWVTKLNESDEWEDDFYGGAVVDYDRRRLVWHGEADNLEIPRVGAIYERLLQAAWPGFDITFADAGMTELAEAAGVDEPEDDYTEERPETIREAARIYDDEDDDEEEEDDEGDVFEEDEVRAWVTIVDADGAVRHRHLERLPEDLIDVKDEPLAELMALPPAEVPPEAVVAEGMWIDERNKSAGVWGLPELRDRLPDIDKAWGGWSIEWVERGYEGQCEVAGPAGVPLGEAEALAKVLPLALSTVRFDMPAILSGFGSGIKRTAMKATGCLLAVICLPLVIFGLVSGLWKPVLISIAITCAVVIVLFKVLEYRLKKSFLSGMPDMDEGGKAPPPAGPLDDSLRRERIDQLLATAGLPGIAVVEPFFPEENEFAMLEE